MFVLYTYSSLNHGNPVNPLMRLYIVHGLLFVYVCGSVFTDVSVVMKNEISTQ